MVVSFQLSLGLTTQGKAPCFTCAREWHRGHLLRTHSLPLAQDYSQGPCHNSIYVLAYVLWTAFKVSRCACMKCICRVNLMHSSCLLNVDHLLPQAIHSLKNQSLDTLRLHLSLKSPSAVELFRALPQSKLKELQFPSFDETVVRLCCSLIWLFLNSLLQVIWQRLQLEG